MAEENTENNDQNIDQTTHNDDNKRGSDDTEKLREELETLRRQNQDLLSDLGKKKSTLKTYQQLGEPEELQHKIQQVEQSSKSRERKDDDIESLKKQYQKQIEEKDNQLNQLKQGVVTERVEAQLDRAIRDEKGFPEILKPVLKDRIRAEMDERGDVKVSVLDSNGDPKLVGNGKDASIKDLVQEYKNNEIYARAFEASGVSGTGTRSSGKVNVQGNPFDKNSESYSVTEGMRLYRENPEKAKQLAKEAGFPLK